MAGQGNAAPVIIKRKKVVAGGGHHGGAWKVAYADFVTAMMAFFLLMWLLGATTEKQRKGVADYFSPTIPINRTSGGGADVLAGESTFTDQSLAQIGNGVASGKPGEDGAGLDAREHAEITQALAAFGGESMTMEMALRHVVTKVTDEGLVIEFFDLEDVPLFAADSANPAPIARDIARLLAEVLQLSRNALAVNGHVRAYPVMMRDNPVWELSAQRAQAIRGLLESAGLPAARFQRIGGFADRKPVTADPAAARNNRIEVILLRRDR
jgi:chemotaxis protein MotB